MNDTEFDERPSYPLGYNAEHGAANVVDNSVNKHLPYLWFNGVMAAFSFGLGVCAIILVLFLSNRTNVSENHWRTLENQYDNMKTQLDNLEKDNAKRSERR